MKREVEKGGRRGRTKKGGVRRNRKEEGRGGGR